MKFSTVFFDLGSTLVYSKDPWPPIYRKAHQALLAQFLFQKFADLAIAFADQTDDADIGGIVTAHATEERALTDSAAAENTDALSFAAGQQGVDGANSGAERRVDAGTAQGGNGFGLQRDTAGQGGGGAIVTVAGSGVQAPPTPPAPPQNLRITVAAL